MDGRSGQGGRQGVGTWCHVFEAPFILPPAFDLLLPCHALATDTFHSWLLYHLLTADLMSF